MTIGIIYFSILELDDRKFWTKRTLTGRIEVEATPKSGVLKLYKNGTFAATLHNADNSCTFQGKYAIHDNKLELKRLDLSDMTQRVFTTQYFLDKNNKTLNPIDKSYGIVEIRK